MALLLTFHTVGAILIKTNERQVDKMMKRIYLMKSATVLSVCK